MTPFNQRDARIGRSIMSQDHQAEPSADSYHQKLRQLAHDLRTPLSILVMGLEALKRLKPDDPQFKLIVEMMTREGTQPIRGFIDSLATQTGSTQPAPTSTPASPLDGAVANDPRLRE